MARKKVESNRVLSQENEENELIALAYQQTRQMLEAGTAPPSVLKHFLELGSTERRVAARLKKAQVDLLEAKAEQIKDSTGEKQAYLDAIAAIKSYSYPGVS